MITISPFFIIASTFLQTPNNVFGYLVFVNKSSDFKPIMSSALRASDIIGLKSSDLLTKPNNLRHYFKFAKILSAIIKKGEIVIAILK